MARDFRLNRLHVRRESLPAAPHRVVGRSVFLVLVRDIARGVAEDARRAAASRRLAGVGSLAAEDDVREVFEPDAEIERIANLVARRRLAPLREALAARHETIVQLFPRLERDARESFARDGEVTAAVRGDGHGGFGELRLILLGDDGVSRKRRASILRRRARRPAARRPAAAGRGVKELTELGLAKGVPPRANATRAPRVASRASDVGDSRLLLLLLVDGELAELVDESAPTPADVRGGGTRGVAHDAFPPPALVLPHLHEFARRARFDESERDDVILRRLGNVEGLVRDAGRAIRHANETLFRVRDVAVEVTAHERRHVGKVFVVIHDEFEIDGGFVRAIRDETGRRFESTLVQVGDDVRVLDGVGARPRGDGRLHGRTLGNVPLVEDGGDHHQLRGPRAVDGRRGASGASEATGGERRETNRVVVGEGVWGVRVVASHMLAHHDGGFAVDRAPGADGAERRDGGGHHARHEDARGGSLRGRVEERRG